MFCLVTAPGKSPDFCHQGYYLSQDTGFYYLLSRYYDPTTCRFINADSYASTGQGIIGHNMFAYCNNNPVMRIDVDGKRWEYVIEDVMTESEENFECMQYWRSYEKKEYS